ICIVLRMSYYNTLTALPALYQRVAHPQMLAPRRGGGRSPPRAVALNWSTPHWDTPVTLGPTPAPPRGAGWDGGHTPAACWQTLYPPPGPPPARRGRGGCVPIIRGLIQAREPPWV